MDTVDITSATQDTVKRVDARTKPHYWIMVRGVDFWNRWARGEFSEELLQERREILERGDMLDAFAKSRLEAWIAFSSKKATPLTEEDKHALLADIQNHCGKDAKIPCPSETIDFATTRWSKDTYRNDALGGGSSYYDFTEFIFPSIADFTHTEFKDISIFFFKAQFNGGHAHFYNAQFSGGFADFHKVQFSGGHACFINAEFSGGHADFHKAQFNGGFADFKNAQFNGGFADFKNAQFSGGDTNFYNAQFSGGHADFIKAQFSGGHADFTEAQFKKEAHFEDTQFNDIFANFTKATFYDHAGFNSAIFTKNVSFRSTIFIKKTPYFNGTVFESMFYILDAVFPEPPQGIKAYLRSALKEDSELQIKNHMLAYSQIKRRMEDLSLHDLELKFHAHELEARSYCAKTWRERMMIAFYGLISDYGRSVWRPLMCWFIILIGFGFVYYGYTDNFWRAMFLSVKHAAPFIPADMVMYKALFEADTGICHTDATQCYFWFSIWRGVHIFISLVMLFLTGLAIRNKLRLR